MKKNLLNDNIIIDEKIFFIFKFRKITIELQLPVLECVSAQLRPMLWNLSWGHLNETRPPKCTKVTNQIDLNWRAVSNGDVTVSSQWTEIYLWTTCSSSGILRWAVTTFWFSNYGISTVIYACSIFCQPTTHWGIRKHSVVNGGSCYFYSYNVFWSHAFNYYVCIKRLN